MTILRELRPNLWLTELDLKEFAVRGALILGSQRAVVWDTLSHPRDMLPVRSRIDNKEALTVYSHADWDHVWGTAGLDYDGKPIIGHTKCLARFLTDVPATLQNKQRAEPGVWDDVVLVAPTTTFAQEFALDLGGITLMLHYLPGHTPDCIVGFIPEWGILLAGDTVETPLPVVPPDSPLDQWVAALEKWSHEPGVQTVIPAHGAIGGPELIEHNVQYLQALHNGRPIQVPDDLDDFYRKTHAANIRDWRGPKRKDSNG